MCKEMYVSAVAQCMLCGESSTTLSREEVYLSNLEVIGVDELSVKRNHNFTLFYDLNEGVSFT